MAVIGVTKRDVSNAMITIISTHQNVSFVGKNMDMAVIAVTKRDVSNAMMNIFSTHQNVSVVRKNMEMVVIAVTKRDVSNATMATIITDLKLQPTKEIVHHVGENMIIVTNVIKGNVHLVKMDLTNKMESVIFVLLLALNATLLKIVSDVFLTSLWFQEYVSTAQPFLLLTVRLATKQNV